jgi:hypothetical protein
MASLACIVCGSIKDLALDHIKPRSKGGPDDAFNRQLLCGPCNSIKNTRTIDFKKGVPEWFRKRVAARCTKCGSGRTSVSLKKQIRFCIVCKTELPYLVQKEVRVENIPNAPIVRRKK